MLVDSASKAKSAGVSVIPQIEAANEIGTLIQELQARRAALGKVVAKAEKMHESLDDCAKLLTSDGAERMAEVRETSDKLELAIGDEYWPLPKYREILFPV
jgi:glutamine synthetase